VEKARNAQLTLVLLHNELKQGTREELDGALGAEAEVSLLCFEPSATLSNYQRGRLRRDIRAYERRVLYSRLGSPFSNDALFGLTRIIVAFAFAAVRDRQQPSSAPAVVERR
jgi:hypothetical protein